jgi:type IV pilus assembly protein PilQ
MKTNWPAIGLACVLLASGSLLANRVSGTPDPTSPAVRVTVKITPESVRIVARSTAPFTYSTSRPSDRLIVIDLPGAVAAEASHAQMLSSANVGSYRLVPYTRGSVSGLRLEVLLSGPAQPRFERTSSEELDLIFDATNGAVATATVAPVSVRQPAILHSAPARISRVSVSAQGQQPGVQIDGSGDFHYHATRMDNPTRLVLDFADTTLVNSTSTIAGDSALIRNIRIGQFQSDVARVVIELERWSPYTVTTANTGLIVTFGSSTIGSGPQGTSLRADNSKPPAVKSAVPVAPELPLPTWLTQPTFGFASQSPAAPSAPAPAQQSQTMATPAQGLPPSATAQMSPKYSGEPIRVNFKDVDLQDFFRLIHEVSGLNVVLDPSVKGSVTLVMEDVPWDQVLDIVLRNNNLDKQLDGNVLRIASRSTIKAEADQKAALLQAESNSEPVITVTYRLSYAKASSGGGAAGGKQAQGKAMDDLLKPFLSSRGSVFGDPRTNTLIIRDVQSTIPKIEDLIKQLDRKSQQVEIEARVVLASRSFAQDIGTQIALGGVNGGNSLSGSQVGASPISHPLPGAPPPVVSAGTTSLPLLTNLGATAATSGLAFEHMAGSFAIDMIITAMESKGVGKLLSAPKVVTQNNTEGIAQQGTQIPIQTNINNTISTQYIAAVLMLKVTPQITADGTIFMIVHIENTQIDSGIPAILGQPALSTQSVDDQVLAKDGQTIMLGGVMVNSQTTQYNEVPLFGSIPVIGNLFKHRTISVQSQELWFFLTPRVSQD